MPGFVKGGFPFTPFGVNEFLRSTKDMGTESYTLSSASVPANTIDGFANQKVLQPGTVMAKITSGPEAGKVGPYQGLLDEIQTVDLGSASAGTVTITFQDQTTAAIPYNATAGAVQAALEALPTVDPGDVVVTGGPLPGVVTLTFGGQYGGTDVTEVTVTPTDLTGGTVAVNTTQAGGGAGSVADGRQTTTNIVGLNLTFVPWQLMERDVEISCVYDCTAVQAWCIELDSLGNSIQLTNATAATMRSTKGLDILFK